MFDLMSYCPHCQRGGGREREQEASRMATIAAQHERIATLQRLLREAHMYINFGETLPSDWQRRCEEVLG